MTKTSIVNSSVINGVYRAMLGFTTRQLEANTFSPMFWNFVFWHPVKSDKAAMARLPYHSDNSSHGFYCHSNPSSFLA